MSADLAGVADRLAHSGSTVAGGRVVARRCPDCGLSVPALDGVGWQALIDHWTAAHLAAHEGGPQ